MIGAVIGGVGNRSARQPSASLRGRAGRDAALRHVRLPEVDGLSRKPRDQEGRGQKRWTGTDLYAVPLLTHDGKCERLDVSLRDRERIT